MIAETKITWQEARDLLLKNAQPVGTEEVLLEQATGRILAADIVSAVNVPPFDKSAFDGYAFRSGDTSGNLPVTVQITEEIPAGTTPNTTVKSGQAAKILTGAPIPEGADAVCKFEETDYTDSSVTLKKSYPSQANIILTGETFRAGDRIAKRGQTVDAGLAGTIASAGVGMVRVYKKPKVGVMSTGSELAELGETMPYGKIVNSNRYTFTAALQEVGCETVYLGTVEDTTTAIANTLCSGLADCDAILTTGGASVGDYDLAAAAFEAAGAEMICGDLMLKPGGKSWYARKDGKMIFGLSGNPASALTNFYAVVVPVLRMLQGVEDKMPEHTALLSTDMKKSSPLPRLLRGTVFIDEGRAYFRPAADQKNGAIHAMSGMNAMAEIPAGSGPLTNGTEVKVYRIK